MKLIVLLVVLALRRVEIAWPMFLREPNALRQSLLALAPRGGSDGIAWLLVVLVPALVVGLLMVWLHDFLWGLPGWIAGGVLLLWMLGTDSEFRQLDELVVRARMNDEDEFAALAEQQFDMQGAPGDDNYLQRLCERISGHEAGGLFATLFFLVTLGYGAAFLYVLNRWLAHSDHPGNQWARVCDTAFYWIPSRLLVLALALGGDFRRVMDAVDERLWRLDDSHDLFADALLAALDADNDEVEQDLSSAVVLLEDLQSLLLRVLAIWLIFAALWVLLVG